MKTVDTVLTNQGLLRQPQSLPDPEDLGYWSSRVVPMLIRTRTCTGPATPQVGPRFPSTLPVPGKSETWPWYREAFLWPSLCPWLMAAEPCPAPYSSRACLQLAQCGLKGDTGATGPDPEPWEEEMTFSASEAEFDFSLFELSVNPMRLPRKKLPIHPMLPLTLRPANPMNSELYFTIAFRMLLLSSIHIIFSPYSDLFICVSHVISELRGQQLVPIRNLTLVGCSG